METTLEKKKQKILKRLENTIESCNCILYEINQEIEGLVSNNMVLEQTTEIYQLWASKEI